MRHSGKGNVMIDKKHTKTIENGKIVKELPMVNYIRELLLLFTLVSPFNCFKCGGQARKSGYLVGM